MKQGGQNFEPVGMIPSGFEAFVVDAQFARGFLIERIEGDVA